MTLPETTMRQELDEGVLLEMPPAKLLHSEALHRILFALYEAAKKQQTLVVRAEAAFKLSDSPPVVRVPDVALVSAVQLAASPPEGYFQGAPTLAVEIVAPSDFAADLVKKTRQYLRAGTSAVIAVYPESREIHIHHQDSAIQALSGDDAVELPDLLPEWRATVNELLP